MTTEAVVAIIGVLATLLLALLGSIYNMGRLENKVKTSARRCEDAEKTMLDNLVHIKRIPHLEEMLETQASLIASQSTAMALINERGEAFEELRTSVYGLTTEVRVMRELRLQSKEHKLELATARHSKPDTDE